VPPTLPSNVKIDADMPAGSQSQSPLNFPNVPSIKSEGGYPHPNYPQAQTVNGAPYTGAYDQNANLAQQRAAALVQQRVQQQYAQPHQGQHPAQNQGRQHQGQLPGQHQQHQVQHPQMPMQGQQRMTAPNQPYLPQQVPQQQQQRAPPPHGHAYNSQTDGSNDALADWIAFKAARAEALKDEAGRLAADEFLRARVDAMAMRQDSGLMVPLDSMPKGKKRTAAVRVLQEEDAEASYSAPGPARYDGDDDVKEEDPDDAINSDLDDPDDDLNDGDNSDDEMVDYMLCTYDKVQRVKNKWKCTLVNGILTTNKRE
jgi:transcription initiation factor TFIIA large subunit